MLVPKREMSEFGRPMEADMRHGRGSRPATVDPPLLGDARNGTRDRA